MPDAERGAGSTSSWRPVLSVGAVVSAAVLVMVGLLAGSAREPRSHAPTRPVAGAPLDLSTVGPRMQAHYRYAAAHTDAYAAIPCYCGCDRTLEHRHLGDCFVLADGTGWDPHASGCETCIAEAEVLRAGLETGKDPGTLLAEIVDRFGPPPAGWTTTN